MRRLYLVEMMNEIIKILIGIAIVLGLHLIVGLIAITIVIIFPVLSAAFLYGLLSIGVSQFIYIIPAIALLYRSQKWELMKGVIIGAFFTALLNGWVILLVFKK